MSDEGRAKRYAAGVGELVGYARCSTVLQDLTAQREILASLGVPQDRIYLDKGLTGTDRPARPRPGTGAVRAGDILVVPKLDRLARSVPDACPQTPTPGKNRQVTMFGRLR